MFDIGWSELLILGVMALIVVGPKELPGLLRTLGKYLGMIRKQATEFRTQFDEAIRETEIDQIRQDMAGIKDDVASSVRDATRQVERDLESGKVDPSEVTSLEDKSKSDETTKASSDLLDEHEFEALDDAEPPKTTEVAEKQPAAVGSGGVEKSGV